MIAKPAKTLMISFNNNIPLVESNHENTQWKSKIEDPSEKQAYFTQTGDSIFLTPERSGLERGITQGRFCAPHRTLVKILCKQSENFVEGAVVHYKVILSISMRLQIVGNHPLSPGLSSLWYISFTLLCNVVSVLITYVGT